MCEFSEQNIKINTNDWVAIFSEWNV